MIGFSVRGSFKHAEDFFTNNRSSKARFQRIARKYAEQGLASLMIRTPVDTGVTAQSWRYIIGDDRITFVNDNVPNGIPVVILLHYGHETQNGGYVPPNDFINPALQPIFDQIAIEFWKEVTRK